MAEKTKAEKMEDVRKVRDIVAEMPDEQAEMLILFLQIDLTDRDKPTKRGRPRGSKNSKPEEPVNAEGPNA